MVCVGGNVCGMCVYTCTCMYFKVKILTQFSRALDQSSSSGDHLSHSPTHHAASDPRQPATGHTRNGHNRRLPDLQHVTLGDIYDVRDL